jgi:hypothetical protein
MRPFELHPNGKKMIAGNKKYTIFAAILIVYTQASSYPILQSGVEDAFLCYTSPGMVLCMDII